MEALGIIGALLALLAIWALLAWLRGLMVKGAIVGTAKVVGAGIHAIKGDHPGPATAPQPEPAALEPDADRGDWV